MGFDLDRFKKAQEEDYPYALQEIKAGRKRSHWIWYIFPQLKGLGFSSMSEYYGIDGRAEAQAYIADSVLRARLVEISQALLALENNNPTQVMGYPDDLKLKSSMTLFAEVAPDIPVFEQVLQKFFAGEKDAKTLQLLR
ncbi:MAG: DUF1810 domain-containing protein [Treponemataceae bacterium]|nr:DUF1810 domain-containing protein [Treponemataceae bacterium]